MTQLRDIKWGWQKDHPDSRDFSAKKFIVATFPLPSTYLVYPNTIIYDQGSYPACAGYASAGVKTDEEYIQSRQKYMFDGLWLYNECKKIDNLPGVAGTGLRYALQTLFDQGIKQTGLPCTKKLPASNWKIKAYFRIEQDSTADFIKQVVFQYGSVLIGSRWYASWMDVKEVFPAPGNIIMGGHAYRVCGWNETGFIIINSWGKKLWGVDGVATMPYDMFMGTVLPNGDVWKLIDA